MSQDSETQLMDSVCSGCNNEKPGCLFKVLRPEKVHSFCTTCVLISHREYFCPTCFVVHDLTLPPEANHNICCYICHSFTHVACAPLSSRFSKGILTCSSCRDPDRLRFALIEVQAGGKLCAMLDKRAAVLLSTAAKVAALWMNKKAEASQESLDVARNKRVKTKEEATDAIHRVLKHKENKRYYEAWSSEEDTGFDVK